MSLSIVELLSCVDWRDGMVVGSHHLAHADRRVDEVAATLFRCALDQPGLAPGTATGAAGGPLVQPLPPSRADGGTRVPLRLLRPFVAVAPSGSLVLGHPGDPARDGDALVARREGPDPAGGELLVCAGSAIDGAGRVREREHGGRTLDVLVRSLTLALHTPDEYEELLRSGAPPLVPIGALHLTASSANAAPAYLPPFVRLSAVAQFDDGALPALTAAFSDLAVVVDETIERVEREFAGGRIDWKLLSRRGGYEALRSLLLSSWGISRSPGAVSPFRLLRDTLQPLAAWWLRHQDQHFPGLGDGNGSSAGPLSRVSGRATELAHFGYPQIASRTDTLLVAGREFLTGLAHVLRAGG